MAQDLRVKENFVLEIAQKIATKIIENLELTLEGLMSSIPKGGETVMTERLLIHILKNTKKLQKRFNLI
jgi:hypothetical protein